MNLKPSENTKIYGMKNFFNELVGLYKEKKIPNKILLSGKKGSGKSTLAYHLINYILSENEEYKYNLLFYLFQRDQIHCLKIFYRMLRYVQQLWRCQ